MQADETFDADDLMVVGSVVKVHSADAGTQASEEITPKDGESPAAAEGSSSSTSNGTGASSSAAKVFLLLELRMKKGVICQQW